MSVWSAIAPRKKIIQSAKNNKQDVRTLLEIGNLAQVAHRGVVQGEMTQVGEILEVEERRRRDCGAQTQVDRLQVGHGMDKLLHHVVVDLGTSQAQRLELGEF